MCQCPLGYRVLKLPIIPAEGTPANMEVPATKTLIKGMPRDRKEQGGAQVIGALKEEQRDAQGMGGQKEEKSGSQVMGAPKE